MRAEFEAWVRDCGCDTDGAWSAWQGAVLAERERCAKLLEALMLVEYSPHASVEWRKARYSGLYEGAAAIRGSAV